MLKTYTPPTSNIPPGIAQALRQAEIKHQQALAAKRRASRWGWLKHLPGALKVGALLFLLIGVALVIDGVRREGGEKEAVVAELKGHVSVKRDGAGKSERLSRRMSLRNGDVVTTGPKATTTLVFPDGSGVLVEPNTSFEVRLLDYARNGVRDRSFLVRAGSVVAYVSKYFGRQGRAAITTPTAVAAVRGTGFRVSYSPGRRASLLQVVEGVVGFRTTGGELRCGIGQMMSANGYSLSGPSRLPRAAHARILAQVLALKRYAKAPGLLVNVERRITGTLDGPLQMAGIATGGWAFDATDLARKVGCREALRQLGTHIASVGDDAPDVINPVTLEELGMLAAERVNLQRMFAGGILESYRKTGANTFVVRVRARDRKRTLFEFAPPTPVREVRKG